MPKFKRWTEEHDGHLIRFEYSEHDNWPGDPQSEPTRRKWTRHNWGFWIIATIYVAVFLAALFCEYPF